MTTNSGDVATSNASLNSKTLIDILCRQHDGLRICHFNAQSLFPKVDEFKEIFGSSMVDIICVTETWLKPHINNELISVGNFKCFRNDRLNRTGGGVALYLNNSLTGRTVSQSAPGSDVEYIFVEVLIANVKYLVGTIYKPPHISCLDSMELVLAEVSVSHNHVIVVGDFNVNLLSDNHLSRRFTDLITTLDFSVVNSFPTHFTATTSSLLDLFLVTNPESVTFHNQISFSGFSNHDLIFLTYDIGNADRCEKTFSYYDFRSVDLNSLLNEACSFDWEQVYYLTSPDEQLCYFEHLLSELLHKHVPIRIRRVIDDSCPWFNTRIRLLISQRNIAYSRWKRFRTPEARERFRSLRNRAHSEIRRSKINFFNSQLNIKLTTNKLWNNLRNMGIGRSKDVHVSKDANDLNRIFTGQSTDSSCNHDVLQIGFPLSSNPYEGFSFASVTSRDVSNAFSSIKSKSVGLDNVQPTFIKMLLPVVLPTLTHMFNTIILTSVFPEKWK